MVVSRWRNKKNQLANRNTHPLAIHLPGRKEKQSLSSPKLLAALRWKAALWNRVATVISCSHRFFGPCCSPLGAWRHTAFRRNHLNTIFLLAHSNERHQTWETANSFFFLGIGWLACSRATFPCLCVKGDTYLHGSQHRTNDKKVWWQKNGRERERERDGHGRRHKPKQKCFAHTRAPTYVDAGGRRKKPPGRHYGREWGGKNKERKTRTTTTMTTSAIGRRRYSGRRRDVIKEAPLPARKVCVPVEVVAFRRPQKIRPFKSGSIPD